MHHKKKFSTGTSEYLNDLLLCLYYKCPIRKLVGNCNYHFENRRITSVFGLLAEGSNNNTKNKKMFIRYEDEDKRNKFMLEIQRNKIYFYKDKHDKNSFEEITNKHDYFNLMIENPINMSYEDLLSLQRTFKKVIKKRNITIINIPYLMTEENFYGYGSIH